MTSIIFFHVNFNFSKKKKMKNLIDRFCSSLVAQNHLMVFDNIRTVHFELYILNTDWFFSNKIMQYGQIWSNYVYAHSRPFNLEWIVLILQNHLCFSFLLLFDFENFTCQNLIFLIILRLFEFSPCGSTCFLILNRVKFVKRF